MSLITDKELMGEALVGDEILLASYTRTKRPNNMWKRNLADEGGLNDLKTELVGGATTSIDSFKEVEDKLLTVDTSLNNRYTKTEVDAIVTDNKTNLLSVTTNIIPAVNNTLMIGSPDYRFSGIYVNEAYLSTNTLYIGDTAVLGTDADTIVIKADPNQSILMTTSGSGTTGIQSANEVQINTDGMNADVKVQATGLNSKVRLGAQGGIELASNTVAQMDLSVSGNLTITGNIVHNGGSFVTNATTVTTKDNIIVLNQGEIGTGVTSGKAGLQIDRGDAADYQFIFDENIDKFTIGVIGGVFETVGTREYTDSVALNKVDKIVGKQLSTEDYTTVEKTKLATIETNANYITNNNQLVNGAGYVTSSGVTSVTGSGAIVSSGGNTPTISINAATTIAAGSMSAADKVKLDGLSNYSKPVSEPISYITGLQTALDGKVDEVVGKQLSTEDYSTAEKTKLAGIAAGAQVNVATDLSLGTLTTTTIPLNSSTGTDVILPAVTTTTAGLMGSADKVKLDSIAASANNYVLPTATSTAIGGVKVNTTTQTVAANAITATASRTYAVQLDASGNALVNVPWVDTNTVYTHPITDGNLHVPATGTTNNGKVLMAGATAGSLTWSTLPSATTTTPGYMSAADKTKLDGIANTANNYVHPSTHDATIITVTDTFNNSNGTTVQVVLDDLDNAIDVEKGRIDAILSASAADKDSFAEIVTLINSVDTANDNAFAGYVLTNDARSSTIETNVTNLTNNKVDKTSNQTLHNTDALRVSGKTISLYKGDGTFETIDTQDTVYVHPTSGATAGTYSKVTVDANGHVKAGLVPTMEDIPDATFKRSVRCTTTTNLAATYANNVLTMSAVGITVLDGITIALNDRILIKNQTTTSQNGIYRVSTLGTASVATVFTRTSDADTASKIAGALVAIDSGTTFGGKLFDNDFKTTDTLGTTAMVWNSNLDDGALISSGSTSIGIIKYNGTTATAGSFDGGTATPTATNRLNYGGYFYPTFLNLTGSADTATASSHVYVETGSDGFVRPKTLANFKAEMFASPTLVTPNIGVATGTSFNNLTGLSSTLPVVAGTATIGTSTTAARADHVHPAQTSISGNAATATNVAWTGVTGTPTTIVGYGITDAYTKTETDTAINIALSFIDCGTIV